MDWDTTHEHPATTTLGMDDETPQFYRVMQDAARADRDVVDTVSGSPWHDEGVRPAVGTWGMESAIVWQTAGCTDADSTLASGSTVDNVSATDG